VTSDHSRHLPAVRSKPTPQLLFRYVHAMLVQAYWSLRLHQWLWNERRILAKLQRVGVVPSQVSLLHWGETGHCLPGKGVSLIAKVEEELRFKRLLSVGSRSCIKAAAGESCPGESYSEEQELLKEAAAKVRAEREARLIAEYDAHFLASMRIQFTSRAPTTESLLRLPGGWTSDSSAVTGPRT
jgi:hypothetical protein